MKRLIPIGIRQLGITLLNSSWLLFWFTIMNVGLIGGSDIYLMIAILSFFVPNVDFPMQHNFTRKTFFKYLLIIASINSLIYLGLILIINLLNGNTLSLLTLTMRNTISDYSQILVILFCAILFSNIYVYFQYYLKNTSRFVTMLVNMTIILVILVALPAIIIITHIVGISNLMTISIYCLIAVIEIIVLHYLVKYAEITISATYKARRGK
ncbi:hypothetical protein R4Y45_07090 [Holzapfeliella sp. He02]|uniref:DUF624 domain-containing protein n=1 Tax=Holzapfeliella saturejae TaxID=3082953 RepID=A0ABU8SHY6_9LACO